MPNINSEYYYETNHYVNPYDDDYSYSEIKCNYIIPTPDILSNLSNFDVPPPIEENDQKFTYTLKNGTTFVLDHPLPPGFPLERLERLQQHVQNQGQLSTHIDKKAYKEILIYGTIALFPFSGFLFYGYYHKRDKKFAKNIHRVTFTTLSVLAALLCCLLI